MIAKIGGWVKIHGRDLWIAFCIGLTGWSAYNIGFIRGTAAPQSEQVATIAHSSLSATPQKTPKATKAPVARSDPRVVASKTSSSKKYHHTWCAGAKQIKPENQVWFDTSQVAQAAGYTLAGNCSE